MSSRVQPTAADLSASGAMSPVLRALEARLLRFAPSGESGAAGGDERSQGGAVLHQADRQSG